MRQTPFLRTAGRTPPAFLRAPEEAPPADYRGIAVQIRNYALQHYEEGWGPIFESYGTGRIVEFLQRHRITTTAEAVRRFQREITAGALGFEATA
jgi:hypothetical protein